MVCHRRRGTEMSLIASITPEGPLVAAVAVAVWPRLRWTLWAWLAAAIVLLELAGFHTPTDLASGLLLALLAGTAGRALRES